MLIFHRAHIIDQFAPLPLPLKKDLTQTTARAEVAPATFGISSIPGDQMAEVQIRQEHQSVTQRRRENERILNRGKTTTREGKNRESIGNVEIISGQEQLSIGKRIKISDGSIINNIFNSSAPLRQRF
jgi:hypothetical protein